MIKTLRMMLLMTLSIVFGSTFASAQEVSTITWDASSNDALPNVSVGNDITLTWLEGSGDQGPLYTTQSNKRVVSMKSGNKLTVAGSDANVTISKIVFTYVGDDLGLTPNVGASSNQFADNTSTWTGEANSITFTAGGRRYVKSMEITYTGEAVPVVKAPVLAITKDNIADTYSMDTNSVFVVYYENTGNAAAQNAKLTLYVDGSENNAKEIGTLNFGSSTQNFWNAKYNLEGLQAGNHQVKLTLTADNAEAVTVEKTVTFTKEAAKPTFTIDAANVTVPYDAESYDVVATLKETNNVDATDVKVELRKGYTKILGEQTVATLAAGGETQVTFTVSKENFEVGSQEYGFYINGRYGNKNITVTFEAAPVQEVKDLAITEVLGTIDLANTTNNVRVTVMNNGNVDIADAVVTLKAGETVLGTATVSAAAGQQGWCNITVASEGLEAGDLAVVATVEVEGDATPADNTLEATLTVQAVAAPVATFEVTAQDVEVEFGAEKFNVVATVKNTSEVAAENVEVKLFYNQVIATQTIEALAAGAETEVTFEVENPFTTAGERTMQVIVGKAAAEVKVTVKPEPVAETIDMAITAIQGVSEIALNAENKVQVWYKNEGTKNLENVAIMFSVNDHADEQTVNVEAGKNGYVEFTVPTDIFEPSEDVEAELVAWVNVEGDVNADNNRVTKTVAIVSGEVVPTAEIMINPIRGWQVEAGEQEISVTVSVFNQSETVDAKNVKIELYHSYGDNLVAPQTVDIKAGGYKMLTFKFNYTFEAGKDVDFTVFTGFKDSNAEDNMRTFTMTCPAPVATVTIAKIAKIEATTEEDVVIAAQLTNASDIEAKEVRVGVYTVNASYQYELVGFQQTIETIAAGETADVSFNLGKLQAGNYTYYVRVASVNGNATTTMRDVEVKVTEPVAEVIDMAIQAVQGKSEIDLNGENVYKVFYKNEGNVKVENAEIKLLVNDNEAGSTTVTLEAGEAGQAEFTLDVANLFDEAEDLGNEATIEGYVNVEGDVNADNNKSSMTATVVKTVAQATFEVAAQDVEIEFGAEKFNVVATVKNTSEIDAEKVAVALFYNGVIATDTIEALAAGAESEVTFEVENPFKTAGEFTMYVQAPKAQAEVKVTVKPESVAEVIDMAIIAIQGLSQIDLQAENKAQVWYENKGNVDLENVTIMFSVNDDVLEQTVSVAAGKNGYVEFALDVTSILPEDDNAEVKAWVNIEGDADNSNDKVEVVVPIVSGMAPVATFEVAAQNVEIEFGTETFNVVATVKNVSEVDAEEVAVALFYNGVIATYTIETLAAGAEATVTFEVENPFTKAGDYTMYVQVPNTQTAVTITVKPEPVEEVIDMAITAIQGLSEINLTTENSVQVWYQNNSNVDLENVTILFSVNEETTQEQVVALIKAGANGYVMFDIDLADFEVTEIVEGADAMLTAWVNLDGDADRSNDKIQKLVPVVNGVAELSFEVDAVEAIQNAASFDVAVVVKNNGKAAAKNVVVTVYDENSAVLGTATIETIAAGAEATATIKVEKIYEEVGTFKNQLQVIVAGAGEAQWVDVTVTGIVDGIAAMKAMYGENVQIFTLSGKKVDSVRRGQVYIINGKKVAVK